jgi:hypothetical protein
MRLPPVLTAPAAQVCSCEHQQRHKSKASNKIPGVTPDHEVQVVLLYTCCVKLYPDRMTFRTSARKPPLDLGIVGDTMLATPGDLPVVVVPVRSTPAVLSQPEIAVVYVWNHKTSTDAPPSKVPLPAVLPDLTVTVTVQEYPPVTVPLVGVLTSAFMGVPAGLGDLCPA